MITYYLLTDGRRCMVRSFNVDGTMNVQLGADGPFEEINGSHISRKLTEDEFMNWTGMEDEHSGSS